jgi:hypothetical protein
MSMRIKAIFWIALAGFQNIWTDSSVRPAVYWTLAAERGSSWSRPTREAGKLQVLN